jgi:hypothetical protein
MENENKSLVKAAETRLPKFVEDAYESVEKMEGLAKILLDSRLVPNHFYEKLPDGKPDFTKGKTAAVVVVLIQGRQLQLPELTALQHIIPVNGLLSIKGDLAKSMIFNSGKLKAGSWTEEETGSLEAGDYAVKITATRSDNGQTLSRSFSVAQAKRAGLWITEQQVNGQDGWKYKSSAWWKYPLRMISYRALGFLARDMFPDVMAGIYTTEEAMDLPKDVTEVIETEGGAKIILPDKDHSKKRSEKMTDRVSDKIPDNKFGEVKNENIPEAEVVEEKKLANGFESPIKEMLDKKEESPFIPQRGSTEYLDGKEIKRDESGGIITEEQPEGEGNTPGRWTLKEMEEMDTKILLKTVMEDMDMMEASEMIGGKNTNKKLRDIIFAHQNEKLAEHVAKNIPKENLGEAPGSNIQDAVKMEGGVIQPNKDFDTPPSIKQVKGELFPGEGGDKKSSTNKFGIEVPAYDKGNMRDFATTKTLFNRMMGITPQITTPRYLELAEKLGYLTRYADKEKFCRDASVDEINLLLDTN